MKTWFTNGDWLRANQYAMSEIMVRARCLSPFVNRPRSEEHHR
jgi:hypothetical protein